MSHPLRFEALLAVILSEMEYRIGYGHENCTVYRQRIARSQTRSEDQPLLIQEEDVLENQVWTIWGGGFLWADRFLEFNVHEDEGNPWYFSWYGANREGLQERGRDPSTPALLFASHFWSLLLLYQADLYTNFRESCPQAAWELENSEALRESYRKTRHFFGSAFEPLMRAFLWFETKEPKAPLPLMRDGDTCSLAVSEANRLVIGYLGIEQYNVLRGRKRLSDAQERIQVALADYTEEDQERVATLLMSNQRSRLDARLAFCELAFRGIIPQGQYLLQMETLS